MPSHVFALKYRPQNFEEVVGQETTVRILKNALSQKRLHHAYLFTGPRGVGKTSLARIFAKALNCEQGPTETPCGSCLSCREITEGRSLSVMEIDGASNTSVEDVRDLREKVRYLSPGGRYKIYIIDEVHMLSTAAFNALLKTLEEPPPHVLFLFATTEPQKVLLTVLSRVIRFDLRPIPFSQIVDRLKKIGVQESIEAAEEALFLIAREAGGSLRDAVGLMDQIVSFSGTKVKIEGVEQVLGVSARRFLMDLLRAILSGNATQGLEISEKAYAAGVDLKRLSLDLLEYFRHLAVAQVTEDPTLFDLPEEDLRELTAEAKKISAGDIDHLFQMLQRGVAELLRSPLPKVYFDILLLRLCHFEKIRPLDEILQILTGSTRPAAPPNSLPLFNQPQKASWEEFLAFLRTRKPQLHSVVSQGHLLKMENEEAILNFPAGSLHLSLLREEERASALALQAREFFGRPVTFRFEETVPPSGTAGIVDEAMDIFGARRA